jgi:hypothetical protein
VNSFHLGAADREFGLDEHLVHVAPPPNLSGLERPDYRVLSGVEVLRGVFISRLVAAADVAAGEALAQVHPGVAHLEALLAALGARGKVLDLTQVCTLWC